MFDRPLRFTNILIDETIQTLYNRMSAYNDKHDFLFE